MFTGSCLSHTVGIPAHILHKFPNNFICEKRKYLKYSNVERKPLEIKTFSILGDGTFGIYGHNEEMWGEGSSKKCIFIGFQELC